MDYGEALGWVMGFWEVGRSREEERALRPLKVPRMRTLLEQLGSPHLAYPSVLIAGTKGKGSTAAFMAEGLRAAGYRVGRYTQPHLMDWRERTWVDGRLIEPEEVVALARRIRPVVERLQARVGDGHGLTTYEVGTAITLSHFADRKVDIAVLEIGVGGRLDALNAVDPVLSAITSISLDHTDVLGSSLGEIAAEKAGILRPNTGAVSAPQHLEAETALRQASKERGTKLRFVGREKGAAPSGPDWWWSEGSAPDTFDVHGPDGVLEGLRVPLLGDHQRDNSTVAVAALQLLGERGFPVDHQAVRKGLFEVEWAGRIQRLRSEPLVVADAAHNADSAERLLETVRRWFRYHRLILVFGASAEKDVGGMARVLGPVASHTIITSSGHRRAADLESLARLFAPHGRVEMRGEPAQAFREALSMAAPGDLVLITGSVFLAGRAIDVIGRGGLQPGRHRAEFTT